ncbi:MAG: glycosyltransferase family 2 protein [Candidatus Saccharibacteria bacterium]|nr:glycosyltransferase family 2 protein [Pseudorhodobacter sp.]
MRALLILTVKNEGSFLLEWLAHHLACGFDHVLAYSNDCTDGTDLMLDRLQDLGHVTHVRNDGPHDEGPQWAALKAADRHPLMQRADWVLFADVDEFVNIHVGDRTLTALLAALPEADAITLTWRLFGNAGVVAFHDRPVTETFVRAAPPTFVWPWRAQMFKTLFRNDGTWRKLGVHRPRNAGPDRTPRWFDGSGRALTTDPRLFSDSRQNNYDLVQLNHYPLGSMESYLVKCDRGRANREAAAFDMGYWIERNLSDAEDRSIAHLDSTPHRARLLADPILADLHARANHWRKARFATLMSEDPWRALFGRLLMTRPSRTLSANEAALIQVHAKTAKAP